MNLKNQDELNDQNVF